MFQATVFPLLDNGDVLMAYTSFIIRIPHLISANSVSEGNAEKVLVSKVVMYFTTIDPSDVNINPPFHHIGQECLMGKGTVLYIPHLNGILSWRLRITTQVNYIIIGM